MKLLSKLHQQRIALLCLLILTVFFFSCEANKQKDGKQVLAKKNVKNLGQNLIHLWETGDTLKTKNLFIKECSYIDIANNQVFSGIPEINKYISHIHSWASDIKMTIRNIKVSGEMGFIEWTLNAKQTKPIHGRISIATNNAIILQGATLIEIKNGKIEKASDYMDVLGFVIQLGSKIELPGGMIIGKQTKDSINK
jgi:hypothetical protein